MRLPSAKDITDAERRFQEHVGRADEALRGLPITVAPKAALYAADRHERELQARQFAQELAGQAAKMLQAVALRFPQMGARCPLRFPKKKGAVPKGRA
ncbi:hypothetical protein [Azospirillum formosense]|uniref:hypothetical protein n=1 Tax=Azospirillum formosense TaxID=861533 RepID=UPI001C8FD8A2|nr:hypothetical protein [Azospirillum formosense]MBY3757528.1 hypothetical protein [Azospirillum formosense]